jgi:hypothetical protein
MLPSITVSRSISSKVSFSMVHIVSHSIFVSKVSIWKNFF